MAFKTAFFAFPNDPPELKAPIVAANELIAKNDKVRISAWPQMKIFGAVIPDEVKGKRCSRHTLTVAAYPRLAT